MIDLSTLTLFIPAALLIIIAPGPDILFLIAQGVSRGRKAGVTTGMGLATGNLAHTLGAALGISIIFQTSDLAFNILKFAGVAYLLILAWKVLRSPVAPMETTETTPHQSLFWKGVLMNILNPKVVLFFLAFLPQFATPEVGPVWVQMVFYGLFFTALVVVVFGAIGYFAGFLNSWMLHGKGQKLIRILPWGMALVYIGLALRLAIVTK